MAQRVIIPVRYLPKGGLNKDDDPLEIGHGDYIDSKNIHFLTRKGSSTFSVIPSAGNTLVFTLPSVVTQNKVFRLYIDNIAQHNYQYQFFDANGVSLGTTVASTVNVGTNIGFALTLLALAFTNALSGQVKTIKQRIIDVSHGSIDIEIQTIPTWDYSVKSLGTTDVNFTIVQEAIDNSLVGSLKIIGSYDLDEDLFIWSTTQSNLPAEIDISSVNQIGSAIQVHTSLPHGVKTGDQVIIKEVTGTVEANGIWIVTVVDVTTFNLQASLYAHAYTGGGIVTTNSVGIGELGVATKNDNDRTWTYTTLLRTKEWNWNTKKQPKTYAERNNLNASLYWTDNYNSPRKFYYQGPYIQNGALSFVNPKGEYEFGSIEEETRLLTGSPNLKLTFTNQVQSGGGVLAGNHRYAIRLLSADFTPTLYIDPTNVIPVFAASTTVPNTFPILIGGDAAYTSTGKINQFIISGIIPNLFKYVELVDIYYAGGAIVGTTVRRDLLTQQTTQVIEHVGTELNATALDLSTLSAIAPDIKTALNIDAINNHLVLSNTTSSVAIDFSEFAASGMHRVVRDQIDSVRNPVNGTYRLGEYADPMNVYSKMGYMHNEIMRYSLKARLKTGFITDNFWIDDIRIDTQSTNSISNPTDDRRLKTTTHFPSPYNTVENCHLGGLPDYDLTDPTGDKVYVAYVEFSGFNYDLIINGIKARDLIDEIIIERVDISDNENLRDILTTGVIVKAVQVALKLTSDGYKPEKEWSSAPNGESFFLLPEPETTEPLQVPSGFPPLTEYYGAAGWNYEADNYNSSGHGTAPKYGYFYCMDSIFGNFQLSFLPSDRAFNYGSPDRYFQQQVSTISLTETLFNCEYGEYNGSQGVRAYQDLPLLDVFNVSQGGSVTDTLGTIPLSRQLWYHLPIIAPIIGNIIGRIPYYTANIGCQVLSCIGSDLANGFNDINSRGNVDYGLHYVQYIRPRGNGALDNSKYGQRALSKYISTNASLTVTKNTDSSITINTFGGDIFTQKTYIKNRIPQQVAPITVILSNGFPVTTVKNEGGGSAFGVYTQNRVNTQMKEGSAHFFQWDYPHVTATALIEAAETVAVLPVYNQSYTIRNGVISDNAFDPNLPRVNKQPVTIWYSLLKPQNAITDPYTSFLPLNSVDLDLSYGEITHHKAVNRELITWQPLLVEQQFFETTGLMSANSADVVLGNAGIMTRKGKVLSSYGTKHGFGVGIGKSQGGKDVAYWTDTIHGKYVRHSMEDGTVVLSDAHTMSSFFNNNFQFADLFNTPADGRGLCSVWDFQNSEAITTVRAWKETPIWFVDTAYTQGSAIHLAVQPPGTYSTFDETIEIYEVILSHASSAASMPETGANWKTYWKKISHDDENYFNLFTISFNEEKNKFTTFYSFLPKIYLNRGKSFLSPRPVDNESQCYEHLRSDSELCVWYNDGNTEQAEKWSISGMCINSDANLNKHAMAILVQTEIVPEMVDVESKSYKTFMVAADFSKDHDQFKCAIRNDILTADNTITIPVNEQDTSFIFGSYFKFTLSGSPRIYQKFYNFICKVRTMTRFYNS